MEETKTVNLVTGQEAKEATSIQLIKNVMQVAITNRALIDQKKEKASAVIAQVRKSVKEIGDEKTDKYINDLIVISRNTLADMEALRKAYTKKVRDWLDLEIAPENELKLEVNALVEMRNARAKKLKDLADAKAKVIEEEKQKKLYEAEIKGKMKLSFERGIIERAVAFEQGLEEYIVKNLTVSNGEKMITALKGIKPHLKEDFFLSLFIVDYDPKRMSPEEFDNLVKRAKTFWIYETINAEYIATAEEIKTKWIATIPQRVKELQIIAAGGAQAERVKSIVEERDKIAKEEAKKEIETKINKAETAALQEVQGEQMSAEFKAQAAAQVIERPTGGRETKFFVLDNPADTFQVAKIIASIIAHAIPSKNAEERFEMVVQHGADGKPKVDKDGDPVYTPGVQFWLDMALTLGYKPELPGLTLKTKVTTIAKAKR